MNAKKLRSKVPAVTLSFWIVKILCTTVGETAADFLNVNLNFGLTVTSIVMGVLLVIFLILQFRTKKYTPIVYWITVMFISVFGTLVTDNLTDAMGVPLETSTIIFSILLAIAFFVWYRSEKTLSIHSIFTPKREIFYWLVILFTFALGTAAGDLMAEGLGLGYATTGIIIAVLIGIFTIGWKMKLNPILSFWLIYILTRPLGASIGDFLSQSPSYGGLGLGTTMTSFIFIGGILAIVAYLSVTKKDIIQKEETNELVYEENSQYGGLQTAIVLSILVIVGVTSYYFRQSSLQGDISSTGTVQIFSSDEVANFITITQDTLDFLSAGDQSSATNRIGDLEYEWDQKASTLKKKNKTEWTQIDEKIDASLRELRALHPNMVTEKSSLEELLSVLNQ